MKGQIIKNVAGKFFVATNKQVFECVSRGSIKYKYGKLVTGDFVEFENDAISSVYPRKTFISRPVVANVEYLNIVVGNPPKPDYLMLDKLLAGAKSIGLKVFITVNKCDLGETTINYILENYSKVCERIFKVSAISGEGVDELKLAFKNKLVAFAGQSAVGKTSIINLLLGLNGRVGNLSQKTMRGKHTTTSTEIYQFDDFSVVDTPGFADYICSISSKELCRCYPEFEQYANECYYNSCVHINEPDCSVKEALMNGQISKDRYERYLTIYKNIVEVENNVRH